ncbi:hypothetical protein FOZ62_030750, partial [Perkinsus olseni]
MIGSVWGGNRNNNNNSNTTSWAARAAAAASSSAGSGTKRTASTTTPTTGGVPNNTKQQHLLPQPPTTTSSSPSQAGPGSTTFNAKEAAEFLNKRYDATNERYAAWAQLPEGRRKQQQQQQFDNRQTVHKYVAEKSWANRGGSMMPGKEDFVHQLEQAILMMSSGPGKKPTTTN